MDEKAARAVLVVVISTTGDIDRGLVAAARGNAPVDSKRFEAWRIIALAGTLEE